MATRIKGPKPRQHGEAKQRTEFLRRLVSRCDERAGTMAVDLLKELDAPDVERAERPALLKDLLSDELGHFFFDMLKLFLSDPDHRKQLTSDQIKFERSIKAKIGAVPRSNASTKERFINWALAEHERDTSLSKNALAKGYAKANPGTSASTLRRYLASSEKDPEDES